MSKVLHGVATSDWHLMGMTRLFTNPTEKQLVEINKPFQYAIEHGIRRVFVPGDMSDVPRLGDHELIALVKMLLMYDEHLDTYYIIGNHDVESVKKTSMDVLKVLSESGMFKRFHLIMKPTKKVMDGVNVCFMPFPHTKILHSSKPPLVFAHVETPGAVGDNGRILKCEKDVLIRQRGDYVISGHLHKYQHLKAKRTLYCGSLYQKTFGESLPKGFIDFKARYKNGQLVVTHEFVNSKPNFILETKLIQKGSDWDSLSTDENIRYKILVSEDVVVPKGITTDFPNIIYINGASSKTQINMDGEIDNGSVTLKDLPAINVTTGLTKFLKSAELDKKQTSLAKSYVREARAALGM